MIVLTPTPVHLLSPGDVLYPDKKISDVREEGRQLRITTYNAISGRFYETALSPPDMIVIREVRLSDEGELK